MVVGQSVTNIKLPDLVSIATQAGKQKLNNAMQTPARSQVRQLTQTQISQLARAINIQQPITSTGVKPIKFGSTGSV